MQARWPRDHARIKGDATEYVRISDEGEDRFVLLLPALRRDRLLRDRPRTHRGAGRRVRRPELPRAARLGVGGPACTRGWAYPTGSSTSASQTSGVGCCSQETRNVSVVRVAEPPSVAPSPMVSRLPCASVGTRKWQRATEFTHSSRMFLNRLPPIQTLQRIDPGAGANSIRATSSKGCAACGGLGATESTSMRTSPIAPCADDGSVVAAANTTAVNAASQLIMPFRVRSDSRRVQDRRLAMRSRSEAARTGLGDQGCQQKPHGSGFAEPRASGHWLYGAAPESNRPSRGLHDRTGFEDLLGHRAHAAPPRRVALREPAELALDQDVVGATRART